MKVPPPHKGCKGGIKGVGPQYRCRPPAPLARPPSSLSAPLFPRSSCPCHPCPSSGCCHCLLPVIVIICSTSSASSGPHCHVVLTIVIPAPVSLGGPSPSLLSLSCPGPGCHPLSSFSYLPGSSLSICDPPCEQGLTAVWRVLGRLHHQHF